MADVLMARCGLSRAEAAEIRELLGAGLSVRYLLPQSVLEYIETHQLYRAGQARDA